ncbi:MAG: F0F1 ATP synthase subunit B [Candidatus Saccharibacteria bacterium]
MITVIPTTIVGSANLFQSLGLNWQLFIEQGLAFAILVWILGKFVYPALIKSIDARRDQIEAGLKEAQASQVALAEAEVKVTEVLEQARTDADALLARSHQEAGAMIASAEEKARERADRLIADARVQLENDVRKAREALKHDTIMLVAAATERVIGEKIDEKKDASLIKKALEQERA